MTCAHLSGAIVCLVFFSWIAAGQGPIPGEQILDTTKDDLKTLQEVGLKADGPALLNYFRQRTFKEANPQAMASLIKQLGSDDFVVREKAFSGLITLGPTALVGLKDAEASTDVEVKQRARDLRERLEAKAEPAIQAATARLIAKTKPTGATEVLLAYLPFAADVAVTDEICKTLGLLALHNKSADPAALKLLLGALEDKLPVKRGAAAEALVRAKAGEHIAQARKLSRTPRPRCVCAPAWPF
jgi:HEAT repeat protein